LGRTLIWLSISARALKSRCVTFASVSPVGIWAGGCLPWHNLNPLTQTFSAAEDLILEVQVHDRSSEEHSELACAESSRLLMSFSNLKAFYVTDVLAEDFFRCLRLEDGELPLDLLPVLWMGFLLAGSVRQCSSRVACRQFRLP
jgi:hypothetical protein